MRRAMQQNPAIDIEIHILIEISNDRAINFKEGYPSQYP